MFGLIVGLACYLIAALPGTDLCRVKYFKVDLLAAVTDIIGIVTLNTDFPVIDAPVNLIGSMPGIHLVDYLLHLGSRQRITSEAFLLLVVVGDDIGPVLNQVLLCRVQQYLWLPTTLSQHVTKRRFKLRLLLKGLYVVYVTHIVVTLAYTNILSKQAALICFSFSRR